MQEYLSRRVPFRLYMYLQYNVPATKHNLGICIDSHGQNLTIPRPDGCTCAPGTRGVLVYVGGGLV